MNNTIIDSTSHKLFATFASVYATSFPIFEQRTVAQQDEAFADSRYQLIAYTDNNQEFVGFIACWKFDTYYYIEHFAIAAARRGKGEGSQILGEFIAAAKKEGKTVILEIDPPIDTVSVSRQHFYERVGMVTNTFDHKHPPYREGYHAHPLRIMSANEKVSDNLYQQFVEDLNKIVM